MWAPSILHAKDSCIYVKMENAKKSLDNVCISLRYEQQGVYLISIWAYLRSELNRTRCHPSLSSRPPSNQQCSKNVSVILAKKRDFARQGQFDDLPLNQRTFQSISKRVS